MKAQHVKLGICLLVAQIALLMMTMSFHACMDASAERAGLTSIFTEASR